MFSDMSKWVHSCERSAKVKTNVPRSAGKLEPIRTTKPFEIIANDIMGPITTSPDGYKYQRNCVDLFTSWPRSMPLKTLTASELNEAVHKIILNRHGCPTTILTDQGKNFMSHLFMNMCKNYGIKHEKSSAYHHQTNGKVERFHRYMQTAQLINCNKSRPDQLAEIR